MLIESIIRRKSGTKVELDGIEYHFTPGEDGRHVAHVGDNGHVATFLAIKEGFRPADSSLLLIQANGPTLEGPFFIIRGPQDIEAFADWARSIPDMQNDPSEFVLLVDKIAIGEASLGGFPLAEKPTPPFPLPPLVGATAASEPSPPVPPTNTIVPDQQGQAGADHSDAEAGQGGPGGAGDAGADTSDDEDGDEDEDPPAVQLDREKLAQDYANRFGHRPNGKWSPEKIAQHLAEHQE